MKPRNSAVFLDRDGVLTKLIKDSTLCKMRPPWHVDEIEYFDNIVQSLNVIKGLGFLTVIVTNQPDAARGDVEIQNLKDVEKAVRTDLPVDDIFTCYHDDYHKCCCRKPNDGLFREAAEKYNINLETSVLMGDRQKDIDAGLKAGCITIGVNSNEKKLRQANFQFDSLFSSLPTIEKILNKKTP